MYAICKEHSNKISTAYCPDCLIESLQQQLTEARRELRQYPFTIEYSKHFEEKIAPYIDRAEKAEAHVKAMQETKSGEVHNLEQENKRLKDAIERYLPYLPKTTASEGGAAKHSGMVIASDALKQVLKESNTK